MNAFKTVAYLATLLVFSSCGDMKKNKNSNENLTEDSTKEMVSMLSGEDFIYKGSHFYLSSGGDFKLIYDTQVDYSFESGKPAVSLNSMVHCVFDIEGKTKFYLSADVNSKSRKVNMKITRMKVVKSNRLPITNGFHNADNVCQWYKLGLLFKSEFNYEIPEVNGNYLVFSDLDFKMDFDKIERNVYGIYKFRSRPYTASSAPFDLSRNDTASVYFLKNDKTADIKNLFFADMNGELFHKPVSLIADQARIDLETVNFSLDKNSKEIEVSNKGCDLRYRFKLSSINVTPTGIKWSLSKLNDSQGVSSTFCDSMKEKFERLDRDDTRIRYSTGPNQLFIRLEVYRYSLEPSEANSLFQFGGRSAHWYEL